MNSRNLALSVMAVLALAACSNKNDSTRSLAATAPNLVADPAVEDMANHYQIGTPNREFTAEKGTVMVDGQVVDQIDDATFADYADLSRDVNELHATTKVIETKEQTMELWAGDGLALAIDMRTPETPTLMHSRSGVFKVEKITVVQPANDDQSKEPAEGAIVFDLRQCHLIPAQDQSKGLGDQDQDKGQGLGQPDQEKGQGLGEPDKGQTETCKAVSLTINLKEVEQQVEEQGKPDQGKGMGQDQGKPDQGQGLGEQDQGKDAGQGQGLGQKS